MINNSIHSSHHYLSMKLLNICKNMYATYEIKGEYSFCFTALNADLGRLDLITRILNLLRFGDWKKSSKASIATRFKSYTYRVHFMFKCARQSERFIILPSN